MSPSCHCRENQNNARLSPLGSNHVIRLSTQTVNWFNMASKSQIMMLIIMTDGWPCHHVAIVVRTRTMPLLSGIPPSGEQPCCTIWHASKSQIWAKKRSTVQQTIWQSGQRYYQQKKKHRDIFLNVFIVWSTMNLSLDLADEFYDRIPSPRWTLALITLIDHQLVPPSAISPLMSFRKIAIIVGVSHARQKSMLVKLSKWIWLLDCENIFVENEKNVQLAFGSCILE